MRIASMMFSLQRFLVVLVEPAIQPMALVSQL